MPHGHEIDAVVEATLALAAAGQADMVWGHVSVRDGEGRGIWMKASGWAFEEIAPERVVLVGWDGQVLAGVGRRHVEYPIHTEIMLKRSDVTSVVHSHPPPVNAFSSLQIPLRAISHDGVLFAQPQAPRFEKTGDLITTSELGSELAAALGDAAACLMPRHGLVAAGADVPTAVMHAVLLTRACEVALMAQASGGARDWSNDDEVLAKKASAWPASQLQAGYNYLVRRSQAVRL